MSSIDPLALIEETAQTVAALTGIKRQFIDSGWDERQAERATIALLQAASATSSGRA